MVRAGPVVVAVSDILSSGRDRPPRRGQRQWQLAAVAVGVAATLAAAFIWYLPGRQHGAQARPTAAPSPVTPSAPPTKPARMTGQPLPPDASLSLLLGGHGPAWLRVATGHAEPIRGLPRSGNGYQFIRIAGGWAAQPFPVDPGCDNCAPRTAAGLLPGGWSTGRESRRRRRLRCPGRYSRCPVAGQLPT
jgi:hypothetical protein